MATWTETGTRQQTGSGEARKNNSARVMVMGEKDLCRRQGRKKTEKKVLLVIIIKFEVWYYKVKSVWKVVGGGRVGDISVLWWWCWVYW